MMRNLSLAKFVPVVVLLIMVASNASTCLAVTFDSKYEIEFESATVFVESDIAYQNWTYIVRVLDSEAHGISHLDFGELGITCNPTIKDVNITLSGGEDVSKVEVGQDPKLGLNVIKFEFDPSVGDDVDEVKIWFVVKGVWPIGTIESWVKASTEFYGPVTLTGPDCVDLRVPEIPLGTISVIAAACAAFIITRKRITIR